MDSEKTAFKLLSVSRHYELVEFECSVCIIMGRRYYGQGRPGQALSWYVRAYDALSRGLHHSVQDVGGELPLNLKESISRAQESYSLPVSQAIANISSSILVSSILARLGICDSPLGDVQRNDEDFDWSSEDGHFTSDSLSVIDSLDETFLVMISTSDNSPHSEGRERLVYLAEYRNYIKFR